MQRPYGAYELLADPLREDYCLKQGFTASKCGGSDQIHVILVPAKELRAAGRLGDGVPTLPLPLALLLGAEPSDLMYFVFLKCS